MSLRGSNLGNETAFKKNSTNALIIILSFGRLPHHKRPPNLLSPGVFNFKQETSPEYYFHQMGARILKSSHFYMRYHLGRKISFVCVAEGYPRPQITWLKDGLELNSYAGYDAVGVSA